MKIGELASATGVQIPTIRFYEQEGCCRLRRAREATTGAMTSRMSSGWRLCGIAVHWT